MSTDYFHRIRKELTLSGTVLQEGLMAVAERVTRKVQLLTMHWRASQLTRDVQQLYRDLGREVTTRLAAGSRPAAGFLGGIQPQLDAHLVASTSRLGLLKKQLAKVEAVVRELASESLGETLLTLQRDLSTRTATMERIVVGPDSPIIGRMIRQLALDSSVWIAAVIRGPVLLAPIETLVLRAGDIVLVMGLQTDLGKILPVWLERHRESA